MTSDCIFFNSASLGHRLDAPRGWRAFDLLKSGGRGAVCHVDRTGTNRSPVRTQILSALPDWSQAAPEFGDECHRRAAQLITEAGTSKRIAVMWSGGFDSTTALVSLMASQLPGDQLMVIMNGLSMRENPQLFYDHIDGKLETWPTHRWRDLLDGDHMVVSGDLGDLLFSAGKRSRRELSNRRDPLWRDLDALDIHCIEEAFMVDTTLAVAMHERVLGPIMRASPVEINTGRMWKWWFDLTQRWQNHGLRPLARGMPPTVAWGKTLRDSWRPFYDTAGFQLWSVDNAGRPEHNNFEKFAMREHIVSLQPDLTAWAERKRKVESSWRSDDYSITYAIDVDWNSMAIEHCAGLWREDNDWAELDAAL